MTRVDDGHIVPRIPTRVFVRFSSSGKGIHKGPRDGRRIDEKLTSEREIDDELIQVYNYKPQAT